TPFEFMPSEVSSEKPKDLLVGEVADRIRSGKQGGGKLLPVCGPAVIHTGAGPDVARLVRGGWVDVLFAGKGFAAHDIESNVLGTSLGVLLHEGRPIEHGHANHLRAINEVRRRGSIAAAVADGYVTGGVMYECVQRGGPFVLGGFVREGRPLPARRASFRPEVTLPWGYRYLMCPPEHFGVLYEINQWMHREVRVDAERARDQWDGLKTTLEEAGAQIELLDPSPDLPDLVFT